MRIHTNTLTLPTLTRAAAFARVNADISQHGSKSRAHAFNVLLTGESRRRPNGGRSGAGDDYAATWDQWGVFLAYLFDRDGSLTIPRIYEDWTVFHQATNERFANGWPADAHGDHRFMYEGVPYQQSCTKCSAIQDWSHRA